MVALLGLLAGGALVAIGALLVRHAYAVTKLEEQIDAIGSRRRGPVEPADWNVALTKGFGAVLAAIGAIVFLLALGG
jgi:hypothetical protein